MNGQTGTVNVNNSREAVFSVDLGLATQENYSRADYFVAFVFEGNIYWLNRNFQWTTVAAPAYQGALVNLRSFVIPTPNLNFPANTTVPVYFGVDINQNGVFDQPYRFSGVNMKIN